VKITDVTDYVVGPTALTSSPSFVEYDSAFIPQYRFVFESLKPKESARYFLSQNKMTWQKITVTIEPQ
jgi:hypothetical protein